MAVSVEKWSNYTAFGSPMPGRNYNSSNYRYGMNGQENDNEITGNVGTHTSAEYWEYDTRLGRRWNTDPIVKPWESPYATFRDNPILMADPSGLDGEKRARAHAEKNGGEVKEVGKGKWIVEKSEIVKDDDATGGYGVSYSAERFNDNGLERIGKGIVGALKSADRWINSKKGKWNEGREYEGPDGVTQFDAGIRVKYTMANMIQASAEAKYTSRHENHGKVHSEYKLSQVLKVRDNPFPSEGNILTPGADIFAKVTINDEMKEDIIISTTVPNLWGGTGSYIKINTSYNIRTLTTKIQSIEMGISTNNSLDMTIKKDIPTMKINGGTVVEH